MKIATNVVVFFCLFVFCLRRKRCHILRRFVVWGSGDWKSQELHWRGLKLYFTSTMCDYCYLIVICVLSDTPTLTVRDNLHISCPHVKNSKLRFLGEPVFVTAQLLNESVFLTFFFREPKFEKKWDFGWCQGREIPAKAWKFGSVSPFCYLRFRRFHCSRCVCFD